MAAILHSSIIASDGRDVQVRIAILEDDPDQLALLRRWIAEDGHDVHAYLSGREAMKQAGRESFDLFMLDWQVPDVSGAEVLMWLRANVSKHACRCCSSRCATRSRTSCSRSSTAPTTTW